MPYVTIFLNKKDAEKFDKALGKAGKTRYNLTKSKVKEWIEDESRGKEAVKHSVNGETKPVREGNTEYKNDIDGEP